MGRAPGLIGQQFLSMNLSSIVFYGAIRLCHATCSIPSRQSVIDLGSLEIDYVTLFRNTLSRKASVSDKRSSELFTKK